MANISSINARISEILKKDKQKFTQKNMASAINVPATTLNNWLKKERPIPAEYIVPISQYLNVSYEYLLTGKISDTKITNNIDEANLLLLYRQLSPEDKNDIKGQIDYKIYKAKHKEKETLQK